MLDDIFLSSKIAANLCNWNPSKRRLTLKSTYTALGCDSGGINYGTHCCCESKVMPCKNI